MQTDPSGGEKFQSAAAVLILAAGIVLFFLLLYFIRPALSPVLVGVAFVLLLHPFRNYPFVRRIIWLGVLMFGAWLVITLSSVLTPFVLAFLLAYVFNPLVSYLEGRKVARWASSLGILVILLGGAAAMFVILVPIIIGQFQGILASISAFVTVSVEEVKSGRLFAFLAQAGIPVAQLQEIVSRELPSRLDVLLKSLLEGAFSFFTGLTAVISQVVDAVIIPFVAFYLMKDFPAFINAIGSLIPENLRPGAGRFFKEADEMLGRYIRGILLVACIQAIAVSAGLWLIGVRYALVLGIMSGVLNLIPFVGFYFSLVVSAVVAILSGEPIVARVISVVVLYVGLNLFENLVLGPKVIGKRVGLHPVLLILSLAVFSYFFGFVGLLIAVPVTAILLMILRMRMETVSASATTSS